jgi:arabinogalactan oligomer/maltooligosaccharide transport system substrate-binding protein
LISKAFLIGKKVERKNTMPPFRCNHNPIHRLLGGKLLFVLVFSAIFITLAACGDSDSALSTTPPSKTEGSIIQPEITHQPTVIDSGNAIQPDYLDSAKSNTAVFELQQDLVITIWHGLDGAGELALREIIDVYQRMKPGTQINLSFFPHDDLHDRYTSAVLSGESPAILLGSGEWGPQLYKHGVIADLTNKISLEFLSNINKPALERASFQDSLIGLPFSISGVVMYRNSSIIQEHPNTIIDMISLSQAASRGRIIGSYLEIGALFALPQLTPCSGELLNQDGFPTFNNLAGQCWFDVLRAFEEAGPTSFNSDDDFNRFITGNVGIILDGTWNKDILYEKLGDNLVIDSWPEYKQGHLSGYVWTDNIYLNPNLTDFEMKSAVALSEFLLTPGSQELLSQTGMIPSILNPDIHDNLIAQSMLALAEGTPFPVIPEMEFYWEPMQAALFSVLIGKEDPSIILQATSEEISERINASFEEEVTK